MAQKEAQNALNLRLYFFNFCDTNPCRMATSAAAPIDQSPKAISRYQEGYRLARTISGLSPLCKGIGLLTGVFVVIFGLMGSETVMRPNPSMVGMASLESQHRVYILSVIFFGALVAMIGWVIGIVLDGYGHQLKATLDTAVNSSPFLSNAQRAQVMRLE